MTVTSGRRAIGTAASFRRSNGRPAERLIAKRLELGSAIFDLQCMNDPSGMGGNIFKRDWFQYVERLPEGIERRAGMDLAAGAKERSDYTSYLEVAEDGDLNLYIVGCFRERLDQGHGTGRLGKPPATMRPRPVNDRTPRPVNDRTPRPVNDRTGPSQQDAEPASGLREVHVPDVWVVAAALSIIG